MVSPNLKIDPELVEIKTKYDGIKESNYKTEEHDSEYLLKSLKIDNDF